MNVFTISTTIISILIALISLIYSYKQLIIARKQIKKSHELFSKDDLIIESIPDVLDHLEEIIVQESKITDDIIIKNFGLDLENVMPWLRNNLFFNDFLKDTHIVYNGLILDSNDSYIRKFIDGNSNIRSSFVQASIDSAFLIENIKSRKIDVEIKSYTIFPIFHGFLINDKHLYLSFTEIQENKIFGGNFPYIYIKHDKGSKLNKHYFNMFKSWYSHTWENSKTILKLSK